MPSRLQAVWSGEVLDASNGSRRTAYPDALLDELRYVRREAQIEADLVRRGGESDPRSS